MRERRQWKRHEFDYPVILQMRDCSIRARLLNLSVGGAFFRNEQDAERVLGDDYLGTHAQFVIKPKGKAARKYTGEVIRLYYRNRREHIALRFWERFKEVEPRRPRR